MPPKKPLSEKIKDAIKGKTGLVKSSSGGIYCNFCAEDIPFEHDTITSRVKEHIKTKYHVKKLKEREAGDMSIQPQATSMMETQSMRSERQQFNRRMAAAFMAADIPFEKLNNPVFREFLEKEMSRQIPGANTLRDHVTPLVSESLAKVKKSISDNPVYLIIDETQDPKSRFCVNVMVGSLNGEPQKTKLLDVIFTERNDNKTIQHAVMGACKQLWPEENTYPNLHLILSDQAAYMIKAMEELKKQSLVFPNLNHVTCLAHALSRVADKIGDTNPLVNNYVIECKRFLRKSNKRMRDFKTQTGLPLPPIPVKTRWGTWLDAVAYHVTHFDIVRKFILSYKIKESDSTAFVRLKHLIVSSLDDLKKQLLFVKQFIPLSAMITSLEAQGAKMKAQLQIIESAKSLVSGTKYQEKLEDCLRKNPDFIAFTTDNSSLSRQVQREFCPLTSVDVERSFSKFKSLLRSNRLSMTPEHIREYMIMNFNQTAA